MQLTVWYFRNCYTSQLLTNTSSNTHNSEHFYYPLRTSNSLRIFTRNTIYLVKHQLLHQYNDIKSDLKRGYHWQVGVSKAFFLTFDCIDTLQYILDLILGFFLIFITLNLKQLHRATVI